MKIFRISGRDGSAWGCWGRWQDCLNKSLPHKRKRPGCCRPCQSSCRRRLNESLPHKRKRRRHRRCGAPGVACASMKVFRISGRDTDFLVGAFFQRVASMKVFRISGRDLVLALPVCKAGRLNESLPHKRKRHVVSIFLNSGISTPQ